MALLSSHLGLLPSVCAAFALGAVTAARAGDGQGRVGVFEQHSDVGGVGIPGTAVYNADTQEYAVSCCCGESVKPSLGEINATLACPNSLFVPAAKR